MNATAPFVDAAFLANPYPAYQALREAGPLHWSTEFFGGAWLLTRHADVEQVLRDPRFSAQRTGGWVTDREETKGELAGFQQLFARAMLFLDAPDHTRIRKVLNAGFKPAQIQALEPFIAQTVAELLDAVGDAPRFDFMQAVARQLPTRVIAKMMGIEEAANADFAVWSDDLAVFIGAPLATHQQARRAQASLLAMGRYFEKLIAERRKNPGDDLVSRLLQAEADGALHNHAELLAQCAMLLFAGHETTRNLLGNGLQALLAHPDQWQRLQQDPSLVPSAVRELLRFDSPVQYTGRRVATDLQLHGHTLCRGDLVVPLIGSANRDPARHPEPDKLDVAGRDGASISFGSGAHVCIGALLTRIEAEITFRQVLQRWPNLRLADAPPQWADNPAYRGLVALDVVTG
ncbi:cytochrome P450 [Rhodoferax sp. WC2427]|uniref:cytochrome P450 n=1 Tax=Rhodoferax sp. WC2427 TaxID=3234144 RepID=UPI003467CEC4